MHATVTVNGSLTLIAVRNQQCKHIFFDDCGQLPVVKHTRLSVNNCNTWVRRSATAAASPLLASKNLESEMSDSRKTLIAASMSLLLLGTAADAATLAGIKGQVMVNTGGGYQAVSGSLSLNPGDLVMAGPGGGATLSFEDGCVASVLPGAVVAIGQQSPCVTQVQAQSQEPTGPGSQGGGGGQPGGGQPGGGGGMGGVGGAGGGLGGGLGGLGGFGGGLGGFGAIVPAGLAIGAGVIGGTLGIISSLDNKNQPASP